MSSATPTLRDPAYLRWLIWMGIVEGTSTLVLFFIAMPLKYLADMPLAVTIAGSIHGVLFILYAVMLLVAKSRVPLSTNLVVWGLVGAIVPFGPFIVDVPLARMLREPARG
jgi:integral membrane protein